MQNLTPVNTCCLIAIWGFFFFLKKKFAIQKMPDVFPAYSAVIKCLLWFPPFLCLDNHRMGVENI